MGEKNPEVLHTAILFIKLRIIFKNYSLELYTDKIKIYIKEKQGNEHMIQDGSLGWRAQADGVESLMGKCWLLLRS